MPWPPPRKPRSSSPTPVTRHRQPQKCRRAALHRAHQRTHAALQEHLKDHHRPPGLLKLVKPAQAPAGLPEGQDAERYTALIAKLGLRG